MRFLTLSLAAMGLIAVRGAAAADVDVQASVTPLGSQWRYAFTLTNNSAADELVLLSLTRPGPDSITDISTPVGWDFSNLDATYVDFTPEAGGLPPGSAPLSGFGYTSAAADPVEFQAFDASGNLYTGSVSASNAVPEPDSLMFLALTALPMTVVLRRRQGSALGVTNERG